jgi:ABC-type proline/glycine betaine transport system permease subunit
LKAQYFGRNYYGNQNAATWPINVRDVVLRHIPTTNAILVAIVIAVIVLKKQRTRERIVGY